MLPVEAPEWELLNLSPDHVGDFMWMYAVQMADSTRLQPTGGGPLSLLSASLSKEPISANGSAAALACRMAGLAEKKVCPLSPLGALLSDDFSELHEPRRQ
ncbi:MAG TPA: hypothetical protein VK480_10660 [Solirubrobacterales bacterium]|nr:hypothetical protein [Solirubrobacterales bacterium]